MVYNVRRYEGIKKIRCLTSRPASNSSNRLFDFLILSQVLTMLTTRTHTGHFLSQTVLKATNVQKELFFVLFKPHSLT